MSTQQTLAIIKPNAVQNQHTGPIIYQIQQNGFTIKKMFMTKLNKTQAANFYKIHANRPFYNNLITYMSSNPIVVIVLEKENAIADFRKLIGATNPAQAEKGTIRKQFGTSIDHNAIHGSDAEATAQKEINMLA